MKKQFLFLFLLLFSNYLFANTVAGHNTRFTKTQVEKDINAQQMSKYRDNFETLDIKALQDRNILSQASSALISSDESNNTRDIVDNSEFSSVEGFVSHIDCANMVNLHEWTSSVYDIDPQSGMVTCLVAPQGDLNNPIGVFKIYYPKVQKAFFIKDLENLPDNIDDLIQAARIKFDSIYTTIRMKSDALHDSEEQGIHLDVPSLFLNTVLTNTDIIDVERTRDLGKLTFKPNVDTSDVASKIAIDDAETFFNVYAGLSDVSMQYFLLLLVFFGAYGLGSQFLPGLTDLIEKDKKSPTKKHTHYAVGVLAGVLLFIPYTEYSYSSNSIANSENGKILVGYDMQRTNWQDYERDGYSLSMDWANKATKVIIDAEMQAIINKTGIGTADQIGQTYAGKIMYKNLSDYANSVDTICDNGFDKESMTMNSEGTKYRYSNNSLTPFPTNENYGYAMALHNGNDKYYYIDLPRSDFYSQSVSNYYANAVSSTTEEYDQIGHYFYPKFTLAMCGKNYFVKKNFDELSKAYAKRLKELKAGTGNEAEKLNALKYIVGLQYQMYNDWGFLSVLGLPITKMQTEMIGGLYKTGNSEYIDELNKAIDGAGGSSTLHSFFSTIPYMFVPGAGTVFQATNTISSSLFDKIPVIGKLISGMVGGSAGLGMSYLVAKVLLTLTPIIGIILLGSLRFIIIIIKAFTLHFAALFLLPIAFAKENIDAMSKFTIKVFATMVEIPLFVIGVWLAIMAHSLITSIGGVLSKSLIIGAIGNQAVQNDTISTSYNLSMGASAFFSSLLQDSGITNFMAMMKLYVFDGFMEITTTVFSIVLIYKIIITFHSMVLEAIEIKGARALDDSIESIRNESAGWGSKI